jgi:hypothetical protein
MKTTTLSFSVENTSQLISSNGCVLGRNFQSIFSSDWYDSVNVELRRTFEDVNGSLLKSSLLKVILTFNSLSSQ